MFRTLGRVLQKVQIYVSNLPAEAKDSDLKPVLPDTAKILMKKYYCFISIDEKDNPEKIVNDLNKISLQSRKIFAKINDRSALQTPNKINPEPKTEAKKPATQEITANETSQDLDKPASIQTEKPKFIFTKETKNQRESLFNQKPKTSPYFNNWDKKEAGTYVNEDKMDYQNSGKAPVKLATTWKPNAVTKQGSTKVVDIKEKDRIYLTPKRSFDEDEDDYSDEMDLELDEKFDDLGFIADYEDEDVSVSVNMGEGEEQENLDKVEKQDADDGVKADEDGKNVKVKLFGQVAKAETVKKVERVKKVEKVQKVEDEDYIFDCEKYFLLPKYADPSDYEEKFKIRMDFGNTDRIKNKNF